MPVGTTTIDDDALAALATVARGTFRATVMRLRDTPSALRVAMRSRSPGPNLLGRPHGRPSLASRLSASGCNLAGLPMESVMADEAFVRDLFNDLENNGNIHKEKLKQLEKETERTVVWYHANLAHPAAMMLPPDADVLENILMPLDFSRYEASTCTSTRPAVFRRSRRACSSPAARGRSTSG